MYKPVIENENINFNNLFTFLLKSLKSSLKICLFGVILFIINFTTSTPSYSSKVSFYTNYNEFNTSSFLSPILSDLGGIEGGGLNFSVTNYLNSEKFLEDIVKKKYNIGNTEKTLVEHWGPSYKNYLMLNPIAILFKINKNLMFNKNLSDEERKLEHAKQVLQSKVNLSQDRKSDLNTISISVRNYPVLSSDILSEIYNSIITYSNEVTSVKAREKIDFIEERVNSIKLELENAENEMLVFLQTNKNITSPSLVLQQERIQKDITLYNQLYLNLSDQLELAKINEKDNTSSIFLLDAPKISSYKTGWSLLKGSVYTFIFFFVISILFYSYKYRRELFIL